MYDLQDHSIFVSRDVHFYESSFPFKSDHIIEEGITHNSNPISLPNLVFPQEEFPRIKHHRSSLHNAENTPVQRQDEVEGAGVCSPQNDINKPQVAEPHQNHSDIQLEIPITLTQDQATDVEFTHTENVMPLRRSQRTRHMPQALNDYHYAANGMKHMTSPHNIESVVAYDHLSSQIKTFAVAI